MPFARLRFTRSRGWELYWVDRNSDFHIYDLIEPTQDITKLLDEIDRDPNCIFFGRVFPYVFRPDSHAPKEHSWSLIGLIHSPGYSFGANRA